MRRIGSGLLLLLHRLLVRLSNGITTQLLLLQDVQPTAPSQVPATLTIPFPVPQQHSPATLLLRTHVGRMTSPGISNSKRR